MSENSSVIASLNATQPYRDPESLDADLNAKFELHGNGSINVVT